MIPYYSPRLVVSCQCYHFDQEKEEIGKTDTGEAVDKDFSMLISGLARPPEVLVDSSLLSMEFPPLCW